MVEGMWVQSEITARAGMRDWFGLAYRTSA